MFRAVWNVKFLFLSLCIIVTKFCVLACFIIWMYTNIFIYSYSSLINSFFLFCVFTFYWLSDEGIKKYLIYILINEIKHLRFAK